VTRTEICRRLHDMVDQLHDTPEWMWDGMFPLIRIGVRRATDDADPVTLVVGIEVGTDED